MSYEIVYTEEAEQDLINVYSYIAIDLLVPEIAKKQVNSIMNAIKKLDELPFRYSLYKNELWLSRGLRVMPVDNYLVFYTVIEDENMVVIIRIMYVRRDRDFHLSNTRK